MPRVFLSYRRDDTAAVAGRIYDQLCPRFGRDSVFRDVDSIPSGLDFRESLERAVIECDVLLALIGGRWLQAEGSGKRQLDNPDDYVRREIALALERNKAIIPVLVGQAAMPLHQGLNMMIVSKRRQSPNQAVHLTAVVKGAVELAEDTEDLNAFRERANEPNLDFDKVVRSLRRRGKL